MAYIKKIQISGTTYDIRDNEALHDASAFDTKGSASSALANAKTYADTGDSTTLSSAKSYTDTSIANMELITIADIDTICGASIVAASEVTY